MDETSANEEDAVDVFKKNLDDLEIRLSSKNALVEELDVWIQELFSLQKMIAFQCNSVRKLQATQTKVACMLIHQIREQITRAQKKDQKTWNQFASISNQVLLAKQQMFWNIRRTNSVDDVTEVPNTTTSRSRAATLSRSPSEDKSKDDKKKELTEEEKKKSSFTFGKLFRSSKSNGTTEASKIKRVTSDSVPSEPSKSSKSSSPPGTLSSSTNAVPFDKESATARKTRSMTMSTEGFGREAEVSARKLKKDNSLSERKKTIRQGIPNSWNAEEDKGITKDEKSFKKWMKKLQKGEIEKKAKLGHLTEEEMDALIEIASGGIPISSSTDSAMASEENKRFACFALAAAAFPIETVGGCRRKLISSGLLEPFLKYAIDNVREDNNTEDISIPALNVHNEIKETEIEVSKMIAQGASAKVYLAKYKGHEVAVKIFDKNHISFNLKEFKRELFILSVLHNRHFVTCYGGGGFTDKPFIVSEFMSKGPLNEFLKQNFQFIDLLLMLKFVKDISAAMKWLHSLQIIHRDLKSLNILINKDLECKIIDFGTSRMIDATKTMTGNLGTPAWIAPELFRNEKYTEKADVYSFGIVMWEILTGKEPFYEISQMWKIPELVEEGKRPSMDSSNLLPGSEDYVDIMKLCWDNDPSKRPSFEQLEYAFGIMIKNTTPEGVYQKTLTVKQLLTPETIQHKKVLKMHLLLKAEGVDTANTPEKVTELEKLFPFSSYTFNMKYIVLFVFASFLVTQSICTQDTTAAIKKLVHKWELSFSGMPLDCLPQQFLWGDSASIHLSNGTSIEGVSKIYHWCKQSLEGGYRQVEVYPTSPIYVNPKSRTASFTRTILLLTHTNCRIAWHGITELEFDQNLKLKTWRDYFDEEQLKTFHSQCSFPFDSTDAATEIDSKEEL